MVEEGVATTVQFLEVFERWLLPLPTNSEHSIKHTINKTSAPGHLFLDLEKSGPRYSLLPWDKTKAGMAMPNTALIRNNHLVSLSQKIPP